MYIVYVQTNNMQNNFNTLDGHLWLQYSYIHSVMLQLSPQIIFPLKHEYKLQYMQSAGVPEVNHIQLQNCGYLSMTTVLFIKHKLQLFQLRVSVITGVQLCQRGRPSFHKPKTQEPTCMKMRMFLGPQNQRESQSGLCHQPGHQMSLREYNLTLNLINTPKEYIGTVLKAGRKGIFKKRMSEEMQSILCIFLFHPLTIFIIFWWILSLKKDSTCTAVLGHLKTCYTVHKTSFHICYDMIYSKSFLGKIVL